VSELYKEMLEVLQEANAAINSAMAQVDAEWRNHDKAGDRHDKVVREFRAKVRAVIDKASKSHEADRAFKEAGL